LETIKELGMAVAWLFPGQGSQSVGMAQAWAEHSAAARAFLDEAAEHLGFDLPHLMFEGPAEDLADTHNQQPALLAASVAILRAASDRLPEPDFVAGHSLGEYSALVAAESMDALDALRLVRERGRLMKLAGERSPGRMAAILGLEDEAVVKVCEAIEGAQVANFNAPGQVVISGSIEAIDAAVEQLRDAGAKRAIVLPITIAAHSRLMESAAEEFAERVLEADLRDARVPIIANLSASAIIDAGEIREELRGQLTGSVRWTASVAKMMDAGVSEWYEIGSGKVLGGLVKRIARDRGVDAAIHALETP
jgi:[acyl-carrier-protein] S-malonyltransferase